VTDELQTYTQTDHVWIHLLQQAESLSLSVTLSNNNNTFNFYINGQLFGFIPSSVGSPNVSE